MGRLAGDQQPYWKNQECFQLNKRSFQEAQSETESRLVRGYIFSIALYGGLYTKERTNRLEAFELWFITRILKVQWTQKMTNVNVLQRMTYQHCQM